MIHRRRWVVAITMLVSLFLLSQLKNLSLIIDPDDVLPQSHPYMVVSNDIEKTFGNKLTVIVGITSKQGNILQQEILEKVQRITQKLLNTQGVIKANISSLSTRRSKNISGNSEGMTIRPLLETLPKNDAELQTLKNAILANPVYKNLLVSEDFKTTQIVAEFKKIPGGFRSIANAVKAAVEPERSKNTEIIIGGLPVFLSLLEQFSERMGLLFPLAVLIIGLIHFEAFRTVQALVLPLVTALVAVIWAVGFLALTGQPMDVFNASTPILILAIAAGHAVQILKRYYEEFNSIRESHPTMDGVAQNQLAVLRSLTKVGPVMVVACVVAALGFFSLMIFEIKSIRTFGMFTGVGVLSALILELTFIPALRSMLKPPAEKEFTREKLISVWDRLTDKFYRLVIFKRKTIYFVSFVLICLFSLGGYWLRIDNAQKDYFFGQIPERLDDQILNSRMGGTNPVYLLIDGLQEDAIKDPEVLTAMEKTQRYAEQDPLVGKTVSIVDFIKRMNQAMNEDKTEFLAVPSSRELVAQYLFMYSTSGEPGDFDSYVDYGYQKAVVQMFLKTDSSAAVEASTQKIKDYALSVFPKNVKLSIGGGITGGIALNEVMIHEKILNILQIMAAVFIVSSIVFRSLLAGLLILVPLIAAVFVNFGVMGLLGIPLQIATVMVSAMAVGIGADYGIYMSYRLREELTSQTDEAVAIEKAFKSAGKAALFVSSAVAGGFGVLVLSWGFWIHVWLGFLIALAMLVSSVTALTVFPALVLSLRPKFIFRERVSP